MDTVYPNYQAAEAACREYVEAMQQLQQRLSVWEECDDSCCETRVYARYLNEAGQERKMCYN